jgi:hypothetical protein
MFVIGILIRIQIAAAEMNIEGTIWFFYGVLLVPETHSLWSQLSKRRVVFC